MRHALALLAVALLATGCPKKTGENPDAGQSGTGSTGATLTAPTGTAPTGTAPTGTAPTSTAPKDPGGDQTAVEECVDRWLQKHGLDRYGHPEGTIYAGGTPLFNEATGESRDRLEYVFGRQPEAREACAGKSAR